VRFKPLAAAAAVALAVAAAMGAAAAAGAQPPAPASPEGAAYPRMTRIGDGVYTYEQVDPTKRGVAVNNLVVVTSGGVLVADGQGTVANTNRLVEDIARVTEQPVRYVVVGSVHGDHRGGDAAFPPSTTFVTEKRQLALGGREIQILFLGRAHTGTDLEVYLPREKIMFMSESFSNGIFPSLANGFPSEWIAMLERAQQMDVDVYVPAHSALASPRLRTGKADVALYRSALERVVSEGRRLHDAHVPADDAARDASFGEFGSWVRVAENAPSALKRVYMQLDRQLP
jgi:glyoxylase-like metal-dependent hydrolase (beta-lactamase superfamily II)